MKTIHDATHTRKGSELCPEDKAYVLGAYVHRFTQEHRPAWAKAPRPDGTPYRPHYRSDAEWLENTQFATDSKGHVLRGLGWSCYSTGQTWPEGK